jgi:hypothetical protein
MSSPLVRLLRGFSLTAFGAWNGVMAIWLLFSALDVKRLHLLGDKGPVLIPMLLGAPVGSLIAICYLNKNGTVGFQKLITNLTVAIMGALLGVAFALMALEIVGGVMLAAFPFLVSICTYSLHLMATHLTEAKH